MTTLSQTVSAAHGEAFQMMLYRDPSGVVFDMWVWNSRDGVTPFGAAKHRHAMNDYRPTYSAVLPDSATHVFIDYDHAAWEDSGRRQYDRYLQMDGPYGGEAFKAQFPTVEDWLKTRPFEHGQPRLVTREEFLQGTTSWMGKAAA